MLRTDGYDAQAAVISVPTPVAEKAGATFFLGAFDPLRADILRHGPKSVFSEHGKPILQAFFAIFQFRGAVKQPRLPHFQAAALQDRGIFRDRGEIIDVSNFTAG